MKGYINGDIREVKIEESLLTDLSRLHEAQLDRLLETLDVHKKFSDLIQTIKGVYIPHRLREDPEINKRISEYMQKIEHKSYGVFTTVLVKDKVAVFLEEHCRNVLRDAHKAGLNQYIDLELEKLVNKVIETNEESDYALHIQLRKEEGLIIDPFERKYSKETYKKGIKATIVPLGRDNPEIKEVIPTNVYMIDNLLEILEVSEIIYSDIYGKNITEGGRSNLFIVKNGILITPVEGIYKGITRENVLDIAHNIRIPIEERSISTDELYPDEMFLTGSVKGVMSFYWVGREVSGPGPVTKKLMTAYNELVLNYVEERK